MDNMGDQRNLIQELLQGLEFARQLQIHLHVPSSSTSQETREVLIQKIISAFEKALEMVNWKGPAAVAASEPSSQQPSGALAIRTSEESPPLSGGSPRSEDSDRDFRDHDANASRKRKTLPRWTKQIRVNPGMGVEGPLDDGYSWRKYGQKDILGALYPRGYYRCTHRNVQGCLATKQVQRSDEDPTVFEITYRGKHTCSAAASPAVPATTTTSPRESQQDPNPNPSQNVLQSLDQTPVNELLLNLREGLRVQTENLDASFHFPSTSTLTVKTENHVLPPHLMLPAENFPSPSNYVSPAASGISHSSVSPSGVYGFTGNPNLAGNSSGSHIDDIISATTTASNSPTVALEFPYDHLFDGYNFTFDNQRFF